MSLKIFSLLSKTSLRHLAAFFWEGGGGEKRFLIQITRKNLKVYEKITFESLISTKKIVKCGS